MSFTLGHCPEQTVHAHGWASLAPFVRDATLGRDGDETLGWAVALPGAGPTLVTIRWDVASRTVTAGAGAALGSEDTTFLTGRLQRMFRHEERFDEFWRLCERQPGMRLVAKVGAGALLRAGSTFEDVVKTLCTVNCTWQNTKSMVANLCKSFGEQVPGSSSQMYTFPSPETLAAAPEEALRAAKLGFRAPWIKGIADRVAGGGLDFASWDGREDVAALRKELLALPGVGPYAANHLLMTLGHYGYVPGDTEAAAHLGMAPGSSTRDIEREAARRYAPWGDYAFLAYRFERAQAMGRLAAK